jgi:hypothetical protein
MELLINKSDVAGILQVAIGYNETQFNVFIREAQDFDLKPLFREEFYIDLVEGRESDPFLNLINGGNYTYNDREYRHRGIKDVLSYFAYARFILKSDYVSNSHGFSKKTTPHSEPINLEERRNMYYKYRKDANFILEDVIKFIERNISDFPTWREDNECEPSNRGSFSTTVIK